ncbi:MAG: hypothetical protein WGN25_04390 [Candidatus Electrothrix sp. GW3-4]|uniref:hypothetical protein n=1 Tax=Candidatus Electrothrix sp. GW3-4 TaxID=3126740 RepID=UPI0030CDB187
MKTKSTATNTLFPFWFVLLLTLLLALFPLTSRADSPEEPHPLDRTHALVTKGLLTSAHWLDSFFGDEDYLDEEERTRIRLRLKSTAEEGKAVQLKTYFRMRLSMPKLNERMHFLLDTHSAEEFTDEASSSHELDELMADKEERNLSAQLRYYAARMDDLNLRFSSGLSFHELLPHGPHSAYPLSISRI